MKLDGPDEYLLTISDGRASVTTGDEKPHFVVPATIKGKPKLYVVSKAGQLLYVGVTSQSMATRLRGGLTADGTHGYHGYRWGRQNHNLCLHVWYPDADTATLAELETIEAEVVFLYRQQSSQWPEAQTEIHFHVSTEQHRKCAAQIVQALDSGSRQNREAQNTRCLCCQNNIPIAKPRRCPLCDHVFQGNGWDGIDAHWRAKHERSLPYEEFWRSLCNRHRD